MPLTIPTDLARRCTRAAFLLVGLGATSATHAAAGYFVLGYGPYAHQSAGASTAVGFDAFVGASNPAKLPYVGTRLDLGLLAFMPYRKVSRTGSGTPYDFESKSRNDLFIVPDGAYTRRIDDTWAWGVTLYGNGGLNTEYHETTRIPGSSATQRCGQRPGNFLGGCGEVGFDLLQLIVAPSLSMRINETHSFGVTPLLAYQQIRVYGLQAFQDLSREPDKVTNKGYEHAFGAGVRIGWLGRIRPWLDLGATYATKVYMEDFDEYRGLLAGGNFDIPSNFTLGLALKNQDVTLALELHRIFFGSVPELGNGGLNSLQDPVGKPLGDEDGSGFNWKHQTNYRVALTWHATPRLDLRAGFAYGRVPQADSSSNTATFTMLAPNPALNLTAGFSYQQSPTTELHLAIGTYRRGDYRGNSAIFDGATEKVEPRVETIYLAWSRRW
jgi:long-chain fatty acid transport protein